MLSFLPGVVRGVLSFLLYIINTFFWTTPLFVVAFIKLLVPIKWWRSLCSKILIWISNSWIYCNIINMRLMNNIKWEVNGTDNLNMDKWYLVVSNHQSWVDILVLQRILFRKIPFLKFFLKKELMWVPVLGVAWWALDFPFMKRYSSEFIKKNPHLKGKDIETTRKACEKFKNTPISIMNFTEGTRFTDAKHSKQQSPYSNLLKPKAGGMAFVLSAMGDQLSSILNITIAYPDGVKTFWDFLCGKISIIRVNVETLPITEEIFGDYTKDQEFRVGFQSWINDLWTEKDRTLSSMI